MDAAPASVLRPSLAQHRVDQVRVAGNRSRKAAVRIYRKDPIRPTTARAQDIGFAFWTVCQCLDAPRCSTATSPSPKAIKVAHGSLSTDRAQSLRNERRLPSAMAAYFGRVEERLLAELGNQLIHKLEGRGGPLAVTIGRFLRNHADGQDELKNERLVKALQGQLPGVPDKELEALADRFDGDGSGSVSIKEMQGALNALSRGEALPEARTDPTPQIIVD